MSKQRRLSPEEIIEKHREREVLSPDEILGDRIYDGEASGAESADRPRENWLWLDKEKLHRKEIVAAQSRS